MRRCQGKYSSQVGKPKGDSSRLEARLVLDEQTALRSSWGRSQEPRVIPRCWRASSVLLAWFPRGLL